jgi:hypothetical protein
MQQEHQPPGLVARAGGHDDVVRAVDQLERATASPKMKRALQTKVAKAEATSS